MARGRQTPQQRERRTALANCSTTERLLALILIELMQTRAQRGTDELAEKLDLAGLSVDARAALLGITPGSLSVMQSKARRAGKAVKPDSPEQPEQTQGDAP